jgi:hypothetical protein
MLFSEGAYFKIIINHNNRINEKGSFNTRNNWFCV